MGDGGWGMGDGGWGMGDGGWGMGDGGWGMKSSKLIYEIKSCLSSDVVFINIYTEYSFQSLISNDQRAISGDPSFSRNQLRELSIDIYSLLY
jgi:hypothetical protein